MTGLVDAKGRPISSNGSQPALFKKAAAPTLGEAFGPWAGRDLTYMSMPGGGVVQFDLSRLTLSDFRQMSGHYQINSSLSVLTFMLHQLDWTIACSDSRVQKHTEANLRKIWTRLVRALSQAFTFGYSPNILQWENDITGRRIELTKIKDLVPEEASVNWKLVDGAIPPGSPAGTVPPKIRVYDGIKQVGVARPIPQQNSFWYPLLMENGDYNGKKLLKYAFQPWYFSTLMHLFSNRYFERFGEPVPIGRAPSGEKVATSGGGQIDSNEYMLGVLQNIRSRAAVVLPGDRQTNASGEPSNYFEYDIEYLESQMRGADFERYMTRLDEEISLALFTPLLLMRTADVGSYNLGVSHMQMYLWQLNAIAADWAEYINRYILAPMADFNFGENSARPEIVFYKMGKTQAETNRAVLSALIGAGRVKVDLTELGQATGLTLEEVEVVTEPPADNDTEDDDREGRVRDDKTRVSEQITARIAGQAKNAFKKGTFGNGWVPDYGFTSQVPTDKMGRLMIWNSDLLVPDLFSSAEEYMSIFAAGVKDILDE